MNNPTFTWVLKSKITLKALGRTVENLDLNKPLNLNGKHYSFFFVHDIHLTLDARLTFTPSWITISTGMGGFPDVKILKFDLPSDAAPGQGINLQIDTAMNNPSPIGITLGTIVLDISTGTTKLGQVRATGASLMGKSESILNLTGTMYPQTTPQDLAAVR